jgi:hypothetical protein
MPGCKFCRKDKKLIEAHIIPQAFVRKKVKEYKGDLIEVAKDKNNKEKRKGDGYCVDKDGTVRIQSNGYFDANILCDECDKKFGKCEDKLIKFLTDSTDVNKYDYRSISLAIKGILWKAHITTNQQFIHINLGKYGDVLYDSLLSHLNNQDKIPPQNFPIWIQRYKNVLGNSNSKNDVIFNMTNYGSKGRDEYYGILYRFDFSGHQIIIRVGGNPLPKTINQFIANDKANISEVLYSFSGNVNDIINPNPSIIKAFSYTHLQ